MRLRDLHGRRIALWGAGSETSSLLRWLDRERIAYELTALVIDEPRDNPYQRELADRIAISTPEDALEDLRNVDLLVRSPVVSSYRPELKELSAAGVQVTTATALWLAEHEQAPMIGITGTKGKTTTTLLVAHMLRALGGNVEVGGNIGRPLTEIEDMTQVDWVVAELSSYQIADMTVGPRIALINNVFAEHADWHRGLDNYYRDKTRLAALPGVQHIVVDAEDPRSALLPGEAVRHYFNGEGIAIVDGEVRRGIETLATAGDLSIRGAHNLSNVAAALTVIEAAGFDAVRAAAALRDFEPVPNRLEVVAEVDGITWVDDSYSSTPESVVAAIDVYSEDDLIVIVGGRFRGQDYSLIVEEISARPKVRAIGIEDSGRVLVEQAAAAGVAARVDYCPTLAPAVELAAQMAKPTCSVVLSPAAAPMDRLAPTTDRPKLFRELVDRVACKR